MPTRLDNQPGQISLLEPTRTGAPEPAVAIRVALALSNGISRAGTRRILEDESGVEVVGEADNLDDALRMVRSLAPDVLILELGGSASPHRLNRRVLAAFGGVYIISLRDEPHLGPSLSSSALVLGPTATPADLVQAIRSFAASERVSAVNTDGEDELTVVEERPTTRELEVLRLLELGLGNRAIADQLQRSERVIQFHVSNLLGKFGARSRTELIHLARERRWLS